MSQLFTIDIPKTKANLTKAFNAILLGIGQKDYAKIMSIFSAYYDHLATDGRYVTKRSEADTFLKAFESYGVERNTQKSDIDRYTASLSVNKWINLNEKVLPDTYEKLRLICDFLASRYDNIVVFKDKLRNTDLSDAPQKTRFNFTKAKTEYQGRALVLKDMFTIRAKNAKPINTPYLGSYMSDSTNEIIDHSLLGRKISKNNGQNRSFLSLIEDKYRGLTLTKDDIDSIKDELRTVRKSITSNRAPNDVTLIKAFEYIFNTFIENYYVAENVGSIKTSILEQKQADSLRQMFAKRLRSDLIEVIMGHLGDRAQQVVSFATYPSKSATIVFLQKNSIEDDATLMSAVIFLNDVAYDLGKWYDYIGFFNNSFFVLRDDRLTEIGFDEFLKPIISQSREESKYAERTTPSKLSWQYGISKVIQLARNLNMFNGKPCVVRYNDEDSSYLVGYDDNLFLSYIFSETQDGFKHLFCDQSGKRKYGMIFGPCCIPPLFDQPLCYSEGVFRFSLEGKIGYVSIQGNIISPPKYLDGNDFCDGLAAVKQNDAYGYINIEDEYIIEPKYDYACNFSEGLATVTINGKEGVINRSGDLVIQPKYDEIFRFSEGLAVFSQKGKYGYIDRQGVEVIPPICDEASDRSQGKATVVFEGKLTRITID